MAPLRHRGLDHPDEVRPYPGGHTRRAHANGLEVRAGLHTGEVELVAGGVRGVAVHTASRIAAMASGREVLVSHTTHELVAGSNLAFESRGRHVLKGLTGEREVFALARRLPGG